LLLVFASTVAVFAYQADKFLDLRYALRPMQDQPTSMPHWSGSDFAIDCVCLIVTLIPFTMMSYSFDNDLMNKTGVIPFFLAYVLLLSLSLLLLFLVRLKYLISLLYYRRAPMPAVPAALSEETRYAALTLHWFVVNGMAIFVLMACFAWFGSGNDLCHTSMRGPEVWFIGVFTVVALLRNYADFATVWPFLYMNRSEVRFEDLPCFSRGIMRWATSQPLDRGPTPADGVVCLIAIVAAWLVGPAILNSLSILHACR
jgi:hypothetical protein